MNCSGRSGNRNSDRPFRTFGTTAATASVSHLNQKSDNDNPTYRVELRNSGVVLQVASDKPIYKAALAAGVQLPIGCDYGGCITCAARLIEGSVRQPGASALNKRQSQAGYVLLCVATPKTDCIIDEGVDSHSDLYMNPFTGKLSSN